jgi:hypothetical protein
MVGALVAFALLAVVASGAAVFGFKAKADAEKQTKVAKEQATLAQAAEKRTSEVASKGSLSIGVNLGVA